MRAPRMATRSAPRCWRRTAATATRPRSSESIRCTSCTETSGAAIDVGDPTTACSIDHMRRLLLTAAMVAALVAPAAANAAGRPSPGAAGIGARLFPKLGNGGYDVQHYDVTLNYATAAPSQGIDGTVTIQAKATQSLSRFDLDFAGDSVGS